MACSSKRQTTTHILNSDKGQTYLSLVRGSLRQNTFGKQIFFITFFKRNSCTPSNKCNWCSLKLLLIFFLFLARGRYILKFTVLLFLI